MPVDICVKIGRRIRATRQEQHKTQKVLAELAEISLSKLSRIERGKVEIRLDTLYNIAQALNVKMHSLVPQ